ncbi:MAG: CusA/CzcA family heavy metal efflux RND transporter [Oceanicoccus sp.]
MLQSIIRFSLSQRLFVSIIALTIVGLGINAWLKIPVDAFPDISPTQVKIILKIPGMTAEEIELQVTQPIETELLGIPRQEMLRSTTKYAITDITLDFEDGTDIYWARQQVNERLLSVWDSLPENVGGGIAPMSTPLSEMFMFTLEHPSMSLIEKRQLLDWEIRPLLRTVAGVADVNVLGGFAKSYQISINAPLMASVGVTLPELENSIRTNNLNVGVGRLIQGNDTLIVRAEGRIDSMEELAALVIKNDGDHSFTLADVAEVSIGHLARYGAVTRDGEEAAEALVIALKNSNTAEVVAAVKKKLAEIEPSLPEGTTINVFYDRATLINTAINTISNALVQAVIIVVVLLAVFLGNLRAAVVVSLSLPLAALATFFLMNQFGLSANLMSLGGLVIAIGMIVDSSVVVVENIVTQISASRGLPRLHLVYRASKEVATPVVSGTLIVLIVFSPLLTLTGLEGKLFTPVALTIVFAMFSALLLSLTVVPIIASFLINEESAKLPRLVMMLQRHYEKSLKKVLLKPRVLLFSVISLLLLSMVLFALIGKIFMPVLDEGDVIVQLEKTPSISLQASIDIDQQIENTLLKKIPEIKQIVARTGSDEIGLDPMGLNETDIFMELHPMSQWRFDSKELLIDEIRQVLLTYPGINFGFTQPIQMRVSEMLTGSSGDISIKVFGSEISVLSSLVLQVSEVAKTINGSVDVQASVIEGGKFLNIEIYPKIAKGFDMSVADFSRYITSQLEGVVVSELIQGKKRTPIVVANSPDSDQYLSTIVDFQKHLVIMPDTSLAPLKDIAHISFKEGPLLIEREKGNRFAVVTSNVTGRDIVSFVEELDATIQEKIDLPTGYNIVFGGEFENQVRATNNLLMVIPVALLLILIILFTTFQSMAKAGLILANIPFAIMGGIIALYVSGEYLSVPASVGLIALLGVAVLNGVVMVSYFEQTRLTINDLSFRIVNGSVRRLRPILMTATTAMFGLLPLVFATGPGAEIQKPLAIVVIGGLLTSTITTLYILPLFYYRMEKKANA